VARHALVINPRPLTFDYPASAHSIRAPRVTPPTATLTPAPVGTARIPAALPRTGDSGG
jgi:hypothetical protein